MKSAICAMLVVCGIMLASLVGPKPGMWPFIMIGIWMAGAGGWLMTTWAVT